MSNGQLADVDIIGMYRGNERIKAKLKGDISGGKKLKTCATDD